MPDSPTAPDAALVERVARLRWENDFTSPVPKWDDEIIYVRTGFYDYARAAIAAMQPELAASTYQARGHTWILHCFGPEIGADKVERNHRFGEEALELLQAAGGTESEAMQLVRYVYGRPTGEIRQEVGGVMNTLAAFCTAHGLDMMAEAEIELARVWTKSDQIRAKQAAKPKHSPLPMVQEPSRAEYTRGIADAGRWMERSRLATLAAEREAGRREGYQDGYADGVEGAAKVAEDGATTAMQCAASIRALPPAHGAGS